MVKIMFISTSGHVPMTIEQKQLSNTLVNLAITFLLVVIGAELDYLETICQNRQKFVAK